MRKFKEYVPLSELTTLRVGGPARYFYIAKNVNDIRQALLFARDKKLPLFILGDGSNIVVGDNGFNGLVLKPNISGLCLEESNDTVTAIAGAGENWDVFVEQIVSKNIFGVENLSAIPGTVGAAPVQNIGAYGVEVKDFILWIEVFNVKTYEMIKIPRSECRFEYRDSIFKHSEGRHFIITRVAFQFSKKGAAQLDYKDILEYIAARDLKPNTLSPAEIRRIIIEIRGRKLPDVNKVGTAGSFFKNPIISKEKFLALSHTYQGLSGYDAADGMVKIPLAWVIDNICKKKGFKKDGIGMHDKQALVLVHYGGRTAADIKSFADEIRNDIKKRTGLEVEFEVSFVGKF